MKTSYCLVPAVLLAAAAAAGRADEPPADAPPRYVLTADRKLVEGAVTVAADGVTVRRGALDRVYPGEKVLFVGRTTAEVHRFLLGRLEPADAAGRLDLARWCMFNGLRPEALAEAREVLRLQPGNRAAADMARSLEASLKDFPTAGVAPSPAPPAAAAVSTEADTGVTPEAFTAFAGRVQPVLANLCTECHSRPDHPGTFKLARTLADDAGPQVTGRNLRAVLAHVRKDDPSNSPLLVKALTAHGGLRTPLFASRQSAAYRAMEAWVYAVAAPTGLPPMDSTPMGEPPETFALRPPVVPAGGIPMPAVPMPNGPVPLPSGDTLPTRPVPMPEGPIGKPPAPDPLPKPPMPGRLPVVPMFAVGAPPPATPAAPAAAHDGPPVDEFDPAVFNRAVHPGRVPGR